MSRMRATYSKSRHRRHGSATNKGACYTHASPLFFLPSWKNHSNTFSNAIMSFSCRVRIQIAIYRVFNLQSFDRFHGDQQNVQLRKPSFVDLTTSTSCERPLQLISWYIPPKARTESKFLGHLAPLCVSELLARWRHASHLQLA